jgi:hypothetical protein
LSTVGKKVAASKLDKTTQGLLKLLFDNDMFKDCMKKFDIGIVKHGYFFIEFMKGFGIV